MVPQEQTEILVSDDLLNVALKQRGCPICMILQNKTNDLMCKLQFEAVHNQEVNARLLSVGGYCHFHFWYLEKLASPVTNAQLLEDLLGKIERECMKNTSGDAAASFGDASGCPVCCSCRDWEENLLISFAGRIQEKDFRAAYENVTRPMSAALGESSEKTSRQRGASFPDNEQPLSGGCSH